MTKKIFLLSLAMALLPFAGVSVNVFAAEVVLTEGLSPCEHFNENVYTMSEAEILDSLGGMINGPSYNINTKFLNVYVNNH